MDEDQKPEPKINLVFAILGTAAFVFFDIVDLIPGAGEFTDIPEAIMDFFVFIGGLGPAVAIADGVALFLKLIPVVQMLPLGTLSWIVTLWIDRHPSKLTALVEKAAEIESGAEGGKGTQEEIAAPNNAAEKTSGGTERNAAGGEAIASNDRGAASEGAGGTPGESPNREEIPSEALGNNPEPMEKLKNELIEEAPEDNVGKDKGEKEGARYSEESRKESESIKKLREQFEKAQQVEEQLRKLKPPNNEKAA